MQENRHTPIYDLESALTLSELVFVQNLALEAGYNSTKVVLVSSGVIVPATTPTAIGDLYINTATNTLYFAKGTSSAADWIAVTGGGGGSVTVETPTFVSGTSYTVTAIPKWIVMDGVTMFEGANGYSRASLTITLPYLPTNTDQFKSIS